MKTIFDYQVIGIQDRCGYPQEEDQSRDTGLQSGNSIECELLVIHITKSAIAVAGMPESHWSGSRSARMTHEAPHSRTNTSLYPACSYSSLPPRPPVSRSSTIPLVSIFSLHFFSLYNFSLQPARSFRFRSFVFCLLRPLTFASLRPSIAYFGFSKLYGEIEIQATEKRILIFCLFRGITIVVMLFYTIVCVKSV